MWCFGFFCFCSGILGLCVFCCKPCTRNTVSSKISQGLRAAGRWVPPVGHESTSGKDGGLRSAAEGGLGRISEVHGAGRGQG